MRRCSVDRFHGLTVGLARVYNNQSTMFSVQTASPCKSVFMFVGYQLPSMSCYHAADGIVHDERRSIFLREVVLSFDTLW